MVMHHHLLRFRKAKAQVCYWLLAADKELHAASIRGRMRSAPRGYLEIICRLTAVTVEDRDWYWDVKIKVNSPSQDQQCCPPNCPLSLLQLSFPGQLPLCSARDCPSEQMIKQKKKDQQRRKGEKEKKGGGGRVAVHALIVKSEGPIS